MLIKKKQGQVMVEYALLCMMAMLIFLALASYTTVSYRNSVYNFWADIIARPLPAPGEAPPK